jgi:hypothetical protein
MNSASGVYSTYQHNGTSIGDIGTSNQAFSGGLTADFGITSRAGKLALGTGSVVRMVIDTAGKIGINTTEPTQRLDVNGTSRTTNLMITNGAAVGKVWQCNNVNGAGEWVTPLSSERYIGEWAANSGVAPSASPTTGDYYVVNTAGTYLGITYAAGDEIYWNGTAWLKRSNFLTLPIATASILGGIKVGTGLSIDGSGVVSVASLATARTISATGDGTWSVSFNGGADVSGALTLANVATAGTYRSVTINAKGLVTAGTNPTTVSGYGITDFFAQIVSGFVTGANSTVLNTDSLEIALEKLQGQINARISGNQTITLSGIITGSGTTAITTAIADGALSIAKTSGLQTALDGKLTIPTVLTTNFVSKWGGSAFANSQIFDNGTNVGIGTDNPSTRLTVAGTVSINTAAQSLVMNSASGVYSTYQHNGTSIGDIGTSNQAFSGGLTADFGITSRAGKLALGTGSVVRMVIDTAGKIGINNLEPTYTLDVSGTIRTTNLLITSGATSGNFLKCNNVNGTSVWSSVTTSDITNLSSFTGFDSRYFTETESDARFVALGGSYSNPTWITSLAWLKLSGVPTTFAPSAHTHAAADIVSGVIAQARLGSGTASATTFLRGDQTWATLPSATQNLDAVLGVGNTAINKQIILNGTNSVFDSAAIMFYKNGAEKGKLHYDNQFVERLRLSSTSIIQIESSVSVGLYGTSTIIGSLSGTGTRMVVADASGVLSTQAIPSGGIGTIDQVLAAGNTSINKSFNMQNGGLFFNSQNGSLVGGISGSSFLDGSPASLSISTATNIMMQITAGSFNVISENVIIGIPNTTGLINLQGTPFNFNENAQNLGMGQNGSQWGADFNQALPQPGDRVVFFWDGTRFVMSHVRTYAGAGGKTYLTID